MVILLVILLLGSILAAGLIFGSLNDGWLKNYFLHNPSLTTGYWVCGIVAVSILLLFTVAGACFGKPGVLIGFILGLFLGTETGRQFWNRGIHTIKKKHRAVSVWRGTRQTDPALELGETKVWLFPWFFTLDDFEMKEYTETVNEIPIEVRDENTVPTDIVVQWKYRKGQLVYAGNVDNAKAAFDAELKEVARAFGASRKNVDSLIDDNYPELLKIAALEHLTRRGNGELNTITVDPLTGAATFTPIPVIPGKKPVKPWGIEFISVAVPNFTPPIQITETAAEITSANNRVKAAEIELAQIDKITDNMVSKRSMQPTAAASLGAAMVLPPDRRPDLVTHNHVIEGLDGVLRTIVNGLLVYSGKEPLPGMTLTPPVSSNPQGPAPTSSDPAAT